MPHLSIRIDLPGVGSIGPGKVRLLELVGETGSIRQAGLALRMSYARAWGLVSKCASTCRESLSTSRIYNHD